MKRRIPNTQVYLDSSDFSISTTPLNTDIIVNDSRFVIAEDREGGGDFSRTLKGSYIFEKNTMFNQYITVTDQDNKSTFYNVDVYSVLDLCSEGEIKVNKISSQNENELNIITHLCDVGKVDYVTVDTATRPVGSEITINNAYTDNLRDKKQKISLMTYNFPYGPTIQGSLKTLAGIEIINEVTDLDSIKSDAKIVFTLPMSTPVEFSSKKLLLSSREVEYREDGTDKTGLLVNRIDYVTNATDSTLELATKFDANIEDNQNYPRIKFNYSIEKDSNNEITEINKSLLLGLEDYVEDGLFLGEPYIQLRYTKNEYGKARLLQLHSSLLLITAPNETKAAVYAPQHIIQAEGFVGNIGFDDPDFPTTTVLNTLHVNKNLEVEGTINGLIPTPQNNTSKPPIGSIFLGLVFLNSGYYQTTVPVGTEIDTSLIGPSNPSYQFNGVFYADLVLQDPQNKPILKTIQTNGSSLSGKYRTLSAGTPGGNNYVCVLLICIG